MKSIRLNATIRKSISDNIRTAWVENNPSPAVPVEPIKVLTDAAIQLYFNDPLVKAALKFQKTPAGQKVVVLGTDMHITLPNGDGFHIYSWGDSKNTYFGSRKEYYDADFESKCAFVERMRSVVNFKNEDYLNANPLAKEAVTKYNKARKEQHKLRQAYSAWELKRDNYMSQVNEVLGAVNTTKQLVEQWEEVAKFIPDGYRNPSRIALPAISIQSLQGELE